MTAPLTLALVGLISVAGSFVQAATGFGYDLDDPADRRKHELWQEAMEAAERCYFQLIPVIQQISCNTRIMDQHFLLEVICQQYSSPCSQSKG